MRGKSCGTWLASRWNARSGEGLPVKTDLFILYLSGFSGITPLFLWTYVFRTIQQAGAFIGSRYFFLQEDL
jgi:hypothetical protein